MVGMVDQFAPAMWASQGAYQPSLFETPFGSGWDCVGVKPGSVVPVPHSLSLAWVNAIICKIQLVT
jgi:hypothetical protein